MSSLADDYARRTWVAEDIHPSQTAHATALRVPFLSTSYPRWAYVVGIVVQNPPYGVGLEGVLPTDEEVSEIGAWLEDYCTYWYWPAFRTIMSDFAPYDIDGGANLARLLKRPNGGWAYRKRTFTSARYWPWPGLDTDPMALTDLLVHIRLTKRRS